MCLDSGPDDPDHAVDVGLQFLSLAGHPLLQFRKLPRQKAPECLVLELHPEPPDPETVGQRCIDVKGLAGNPKSFGTIMGISSLIVMIGMTAGPIICGVMYDIYGDYQLAFTSMAFVSLTGLLCFWAAKPPKKTLAAV